MSRAGVAPVLLAVPLLMLALAPVRGSPLHGPGRCRCLENSSKFIHPNALAKLEFLPKSSSCSNNEVIATLKKSKEEICLNPDSRNVKKLLDTILKKNQSLHKKNPNKGKKQKHLFRLPKAKPSPGSRAEPKRHL
ncbi:C-X-C motif chemokine 10 isoform X1 [Ornithorhynchus anatinus]|uniref:C-X-C motif chemokine 10 isoform X1 n=1 Tax=Ornithorhynchus anatinus TaxID=9258 RepID=UPI00045424E9|nr:C-X-C motif chemokine 10 isoform X1 [Ornithorhynchus anatinus]